VKGAQLAGVFNYAGGQMRGLQVSGVTNVTWGPVQGFQAAGVLNLAGSLQGFSDGRGVQAAGVINISRGYMNHIQIAGVTNYAGSFKGWQASGVVNISPGPVQGIQTSGVANFSGLHRGWQASGVTNISPGPVQGAQVTGVFNFAGSITGAQLGTVNVAAGEMHGLQLSVINYADKVHGVQIGVINVAKEMDGASIGIVNYAGNGILEPTIWGSDFSPLNIGLKMGSRHLYGLLGFGVHPFGKQEYSHAVFGLGGHIEAKPVWIDIDAAHHQLYADYVYNDELDFIDSLRVSVGYRILDQLSLYAGPTLNFFCSELRKDAGLGLNFWSRADGDRNLKLFPGFLLGLQYEPRWGKLNVP
jgi:hypothetical protein